MNKTRKLLFSLASIVAMFFVATAPIVASPTVSAAESCKGTDTYFNWNCANDQNGIIGVVMTLYNWLSTGVLIVVVIGIIVGAIQYGSAHGVQEHAKKGIETMRNALLALVLYFIMWALLNFLVPGGLFNDNGTVKTSDVKDSHYVG